MLLKLLSKAFLQTYTTDRVAPEQLSIPLNELSFLFARKSFDSLTSPTWPTGLSQFQKNSQIG
jgi:hypothetical protein